MNCLFSHTFGGLLTLAVNSCANLSGNREEPSCLRPLTSKSFLTKVREPQSSCRHQTLKIRKLVMEKTIVYLRQKTQSEQIWIIKFPSWFRIAFHFGEQSVSWGKPPKCLHEYCVSDGVYHQGEAGESRDEWMGTSSICIRAFHRTGIAPHLHERNQLISMHTNWRWHFLNLLSLYQDLLGWFGEISLKGCGEFILSHAGRYRVTLLTWTKDRVSLNIRGTDFLCK